MDESIVNAALSSLGMKCKDTVTGFQGMVTSVTFDAYGCVQAWITPKAQEGKLVESQWFDFKRLEISKTRIMPQPTFQQTRRGEENGCNRLSKPSNA